MNQMRVFDGPSEVEELISMAEGKGKAWYSGSLKTVSVRLPIHAYGAVAAVAEMAGTSMNMVVSKMVDSALEEIGDGLSQESRERLVRLQAAHIERCGIDDPDTSSGEI